MDLKLTKQQQAALRADLLAHRAGSALSDAEYARTVLRVSLNTFKKCVSASPGLTIKRRVFNSLVANAKLDARRYGGTTAVAAAPTNYGGYTKDEYGYIAGRYFLFRRSFRDGVAITRAVLDITWSESHGCLVFNEQHRFKADTGTWQANDLTGQIYMHAERVLMGLLAIDDGDTRLTLLHIPPRHAHGTGLGQLRTSGAVLTHGYPKRFYQPVVSPVVIEAIPTAKRNLAITTLCARLTKGMDGYAEAADGLAVAEDFACVMTPSMWRNAKDGP